MRRAVGAVELQIQVVARRFALEHDDEPIAAGVEVFETDSLEHLNIVD